MVAPTTLWLSNTATQTAVNDSSIEVEDSHGLSIARLPGADQQGCFSFNPGLEKRESEPCDQHGTGWCCARLDTSCESVLHMSCQHWKFYEVVRVPEDIELGTWVPELQSNRMMEKLRLVVSHLSKFAVFLHGETSDS